MLNMHLYFGKKVRQSKIYTDKGGMVLAILRVWIIQVGCSLLLFATSSHAQLGPLTLAKFEALRLSPESAGSLIYRGDTFARHTPSEIPLFRYERRVLTASHELTAFHLTSDLTGRLIIAESAVVSPHYEVTRFDVVNQQSGFTGSVHVSKDGQHLEYELNHNGTVSKASEDVTDAVVSGPSMFGFILKNWASLRAGAVIPVRIIELKDKTTYGFEIRFEKQINGQALFSVTPRSVLIRMAVAPLSVVFDATTKTVIRYEGRVPPMESLSGKLKNLDARVEYTSISSVYR